MDDSSFDTLDKGNGTRCEIKKGEVTDLDITIVSLSYLLTYPLFPFALALAF